MFLTLVAAIALAQAGLPMGGSPAPVPIPHFPDRLHAFVWRNWQLVSAQRMARTVGAKPDDIVRLGKSMGLTGPPAITKDQLRRSYITIIRRNWHLLPYDQLLTLLDWPADKLAYTLREDDFLFVKLGNLKPKCEPITFQPPNEAAKRREAEIASMVRAEFPNAGTMREPLFDFVRQLSSPHKTAASANPDNSLRMCYSYFALYGDPLMDTAVDPYPDGYLARLAEVGINAVWLQGVLYKLAPYPFDLELSKGHETRLKNLNRLIERASKHGIRVYLYLNEPRAMPVSFYNAHPELKGAIEGDHAALCTSAEPVKKYIREAVASVCRAAPGLGGFFTITASENLTNCWSHGRGSDCPRCSKREPADVVAEVDRLIQLGIGDGTNTGPDLPPGNRKTELIAWDWGWSDAWIEGIIAGLPAECSVMSVSEWGVPIERGGIKSEVGEYSLSTIGPGPRAKQTWSLAKKRGLKAVAKLQVSNSWELSAVPYIPAVRNAAEQVINLKLEGIDGILMGWTLGGYPSPNLEAAARLADPTIWTQWKGKPRPEVPCATIRDAALHAVAERRFGKPLSGTVVPAWHEWSNAFSRFPFNIGTVYSAPLQMGPANPLWGEKTGYAATMVGIPYDDQDAWRSIYPAETFSSLLRQIALEYERVIHVSRLAAPGKQRTLEKDRAAFDTELRVAEASAIHFASVANQSDFVRLRNSLPSLTGEARSPVLDQVSGILKSEVELAKRLYAIQVLDSRIGFEATNQYYYIPIDLIEKVINCRDLLDRWLPGERRKAANQGQ